MRYLKFWYIGAYEQSMGAYQTAYDKGYRVMVVNIRQTHDGHFVCWHDDDVSEVAYLKDKPVRGEWKISEHSMHELERLRFFPKPFSMGGAILKFIDFLAYIKTQKNLMIEVELKGCFDNNAIRNVTDIIKRSGIAEHNIIIHSNNSKLDNESVLKEFGNILPDAYLSMTCNNNAKLESMLSLDVSNRKLLTITNFKNRIPDTLCMETLKRLNEKGVGVIFSEVKNKRDKHKIMEYIPYLNYVASRFPEL